MATTPAPGVQLYLYRLLTSALGTGRQALLPKVEEALATDGIDPADLDYASVRELLETLDFVTLTDFRGGRTYATLAARADFDEALAALADAEAEGAKPKKGGRPWKRKRATLKPVRPQHKVMKRAKAVPAPEPMPTDDQAKGDARVIPTDAHENGERAPEPTSGIPDEPEPDVEQGVSEYEKPAPEEPPVARTLAEILAEARAEEAARAAEEAARAEEEATPSEDAQKAEAVPVGSAASTRADEAGGSAARQPAAEDTTTSAAETVPPSPTGANPAARDLPRGLPVTFWDDVRCPDELLAALANLLPLDADAHTVVEEDWQVARSTGALRASRTQASFALRYHDVEGEPVSVTIERQTGAAKRWVVAAVEGTAVADTLAHTSQDASLDLLPEMPLAPGEAWVELSASRLPAYRRRNLAHEFAAAIAIDSWGAFCSRMAEAAAAESWGPKDADGLSHLHEYLLVNLTRAFEQKRVAKLPGGGAVWDTGLVTPTGEQIYCILGDPRTDGARPLVDICTSTDARLVDVELPLPASYIETLDDVLVAPGTSIEVAPHAHVSDALAQTALTRATASWRTAVTAWDPQDRRCKLLLPASTTSEAIDAALLAESDPEHPSTLVARRLLPLQVAYACARVVSGDLPAWLLQVATR